ncbi:hypothetical protein E4U43_001120, partial [Claviceps pusilla]
WPGCKAIRNGVKICLSKGHPPMPAPISNAVCGPQKPGTPAAKPGTDLSTLNPCPLNACCNTLGQCGVTEDFCISTQGSGSPGTGKNGTLGCISNCGMDVRTGDPPKEFINMAYFDGLNLGRGCLNMDISQVDKSYTHIHFAFGQIKPDFGIEFQDSYASYLFDQLTKLRNGPKRVLSFGGWAFTPKSSFYPIFRNGIKPENREKFASSISKFADVTGIDGVDFVWETPGAPDVPGIPPRTNPNEGADYAAFLKLLRSKLNKGKTLSIAAPASYWHLMQFPIKEISETVDYIVYMTHDLQRQWDSTQKWIDPACPMNDCLGNPINIGDTFTALVRIFEPPHYIIRFGHIPPSRSSFRNSNYFEFRQATSSNSLRSVNISFTLITRAGVPSAKIVVALTSYGRSFKLADPSCTGPSCRTKGKRDEASLRSTRGLCTNIAGYIGNAEVVEIAQSSGNKFWYDKESDTQMVTYDRDSWVAFMTPQIKASRKKKFKNLNLGGTGDFAVDLDTFHSAPSNEQVTWETFKHNVKNFGKESTCDWEFRSGTWVNRTCTQDEVASPFNHTASERWIALEADAAWNDAKARWLFCDKGKIGFSQSVSQFFHANENAKCNDLASVDNCDPIATCQVHNSPSDAKKSYTGPAAYLVWNSLATVHGVLKNYGDSLRDASAQIDRTKQEFVDTFAPEGEQPDKALILGIVLSLVNAPLQVMGSMYFKGLMNNIKYFVANPLKGDIVKDVSMQFLSLSVSIASRFAKSETIKEVTFSTLYDSTVKKWGDQVDSLVVTLFSGEDESLLRLGKLIQRGNMVPATSDVSRRDMEHEHTKNFLQSRIAERVFYSAAIPQLWRMRQPWSEYPVVLDFGPTCDRDIGSGNYIFAHKVKFNDGYVCHNNHAYILGSTFERNNTGPNCSSDYGWNCGSEWIKAGYLWSPPGLKQIQQPNIKFGNVTVEDLVAGAVETWKRNGKVNKMDGSIGGLDPLNRDDFQTMWDSGIRTPGHIRIPVCSPHEATQLAMDGPNWIPPENVLSFPCLQDPKKGYRSKQKPWTRWEFDGPPYQDMDK